MDLVSDVTMVAVDRLKNGGMVDQMYLYVNKPSRRCRCRVEDKDAADGPSDLGVATLPVA